MISNQGIDPMTSAMMSESDRKLRFLELVVPIKPALMRYCRALSVDRDIAKDLASDSIVAAYEAFTTTNAKGGIRSEDSLKSYLFTTAYRLARRSWRRRDTRADLASASSIHSATTSPDVLTDIHLLQEALDALPEAQREALVLFEIAGLSLAEVRAIQGVSLSAVKMRVVRGREKLAELLGEQRVVVKAAENGRLDKLNTYSI